MNSRRHLHLTLLAFFLAGVLIILRPPLPASAQEAGAQEPAAKPFEFSGDKTSISFIEGDRTSILEGNARISSDELMIRADRIELSGEDFRYVRCSGEVELNDAKQGIRLTSGSLFFDRRKELLRVRDYGEMVDLKNEVVVKFGYMEHFSLEDLSIFQIAVRILKVDEEGEMISRSDYARYDHAANTLELSGSPSVIWNGDRYRALRIRIDLDTEEIQMDGAVEGEVSPKNE
ncbi:MAG TPA: hypothetical protein ENN41_00530 [Sediminispirochaeta sp.]|nr:hypothetical protein [Sediminispirochaeta sp.]